MKMETLQYCIDNVYKSIRNRFLQIISLVFACLCNTYVIHNMKHFKQVLPLFGLLILFMIVAGSEGYSQSEYIGNNRELFVDDFLIDLLDGAMLEMHAPKDEGIAFNLDNPWEGKFSLYSTIIKDGAIYRAYYRGMPGVEEGNNRELTCYAESKDGLNWYKPNLGIHEINGSKGLNNWVSRNNYPALNVVQTSEHEMSIYVNQDYAQPTAHLRRYSIRLDGFSSLSAGYGGGEMITKPFVFDGKALELNFSTSAAGEIFIELLDENGLKIPGFSKEECQPIIGNELERTVYWNKSTNVSKLSGKAVRMKIYLKDAAIYSFRFH